MIRSIPRSLARYLMYFLAGLYRVIPMKVMREVGRGILFILWPFLGRQRAIAEESLAIAFGDEKSPEEQKKILCDCFYNIVDSGGEILYYYLHHPEKLRDIMTVRGLSRLDESLAKGRGVLAVTGHYGNFPLMVMHLALLGYPVSIIVRPLRDPKADIFLYTKGINGRFETIYSMPRMKCVTRVVKALRENRVVLLLADQNFGSNGGVYVDFFGRPAATAPGPVVFAKRSGAVVLPVFTYRKNDGGHMVDFHQPFLLEKGDNEHEMTLQNTARLTAIIEQEISKRPREWGWMHRRWKTQPLNG